MEELVILAVFVGCIWIGGMAWDAWANRSKPMARYNTGFNKHLQEWRKMMVETYPATKGD